MQIFELTKENAPLVAKFMAKIKPEWWDYDGAIGQLTDINTVFGTVGQFIGKDKEHLKGWMLCRELRCYNSIELECWEYDDNGVFSLEHKLKDLFDTACEYAKSKGYLTFRTAMGFNTV